MCTYTNVAVDNLVEGFVRQGLKPLRVGFEGKAKEEFEGYLLEYQFDNHPLQLPFQKIIEEIQELSRRIRDLSSQIRKLKEASSFSSRNMQERVGECFACFHSLE